jgi:hypothetical protein
VSGINALEQIWHHPVLDFYPPTKKVKSKKSSISPKKIAFFPTPNPYNSEEKEDELTPTPLSDLPKLDNWVSAFTTALVESLDRKRNPAQLSRWCHYGVYQKITERVKLGFPHGANLKIRRVIIHQPLPGVAEVTLILKVGEKAKAIVMRFEGVNLKWQCTVFDILE